MAAKEFYHDIDLVKVSEIKNFRVHNITTTDRGTLGGTLSGTHTGLTVYDTDLDGLFVWDGSAWDSIGTVSAATTSVSGIVELATDAETSTGTDTTRAVTPSGITQWRSDKKITGSYFISGASLVANTPLTVTHSLALQNKNAFIINVMSGDSQVSVDVDSVDANSLTVTSAVAITASITVIGF